MNYFQSKEKSSSTEYPFLMGDRLAYDNYYRFGIELAKLSVRVNALISFLLKKAGLVPQGWPFSIWPLHRQKLGQHIYLEILEIIPL